MYPHAEVFLEFSNCHPSAARAVMKPHAHRTLVWGLGGGLNCGHKQDMVHGKKQHACGAT